MKYEFYFGTSNILKAIYQDCVHAQKTIKIEEYIFTPDHTGKKFIELFTQKAEENVKIYLHLDTVGSHILYYSSKNRKMLEERCALKFHRPYNFYFFINPNAWFPRNHKKIILIDSKIAYIGGMCFSDEMIDWHDSCIRIEDENILHTLETTFQHQWDFLNTKLQNHPTHLLPRHSDIQFLLNHPMSKTYEINHAILDAIFHAKKYIYIVSPMFIPTSLLMKALKNAAKRGIDIKIIVTAVIDHSITQYVTLSYYPKLLKLNIKIYEYKQKPLHAKYMVVDDEWVTIGSMNFDYLSFYRNYEFNIGCNDKNSVLTLKQQFLTDLTCSEAITFAWYKSQSIFVRLIGYLGRMIKSYL